MSTITEIVDVEVPVSTAYNQWTQFVPTRAEAGRAGTRTAIR